MTREKLILAAVQTIPSSDPLAAEALAIRFGLIQARTLSADTNAVGAIRTQTFSKEDEYLTNPPKAVVCSLLVQLF